MSLPPPLPIRHRGVHGAAAVSRPPRAGSSLGLHPRPSRAGRFAGAVMIGEPLLRADDLAMSFPVRGGILSLVKGGPRLVVRALNGASVAVHHGETLAVVG